ncbi:hypothetical protein MCUN1_003754 [Malassezia cuniculi]|uniref:Mitochondrial genome maintenance protein MGM101 n=1 Tax=Malassezia cuniculi TaxID=948313 RepID=A0AAF0EXA5_9BASI|nr:hypothetical protein MCUN1_003754 [Malassezia cuniculi]
MSRAAARDVPPAAKPAAAATAAASSAPAETGARVASPAAAAAPQQFTPPAATVAETDSGEWQTGFDGIGQRPFPPEVAKVLLEPIRAEDVEIKPDGMLYLPEIKYRRILNSAFGPGGWGLVPRSEADTSQGMVSREWSLICLGRFVATSRGEQEYFKPSGVSMANEGAKSNALMRCCKDLGIASELWDPRFVRRFKSQHCVEVWCQGADGKKRKLWRRRDDGPLEYPYKEIGTV